MDEHERKAAVEIIKTRAAELGRDIVRSEEGLDLEEGDIEPPDDPPSWEEVEERMQEIQEELARLRAGEV